MTLLENLKDITNFPWRWIFCLPFVPSARYCLVRDWVFEQSFRFFTWPEIMTFCYKTFCQNFIWRSLSLMCCQVQRLLHKGLLADCALYYFPSEFNLLVMPQGIVPWGYFILKVLAWSPLSAYFFFCLIPPLPGPYQWCQQGYCCSSVPWGLWPPGSCNVWFPHCWEAEDYDKSSQCDLQDLLWHDA